MAGRFDPPEGTPGGAPGAGDEDYPSTVFDESFVRAARLQEFSAQERLEDHTSAVRRRLPEAGAPQLARTVPKQGIALALIILMAFAAAIYLGANNPYQVTRSLRADPPSGGILALAPEGAVPAVTDAADLFAGHPAAGFGEGVGGVELPDPRATDHFSSEQVMAGLTLAKEYVVASAMTPEVLAGRTRIPVRQLLGAEQQRQFDRALGGQYPQSAATHWLLRFDESEVALADPRVRVNGSFSYTEIADDLLQIDGRHVLVYALRLAGPAGGEISLFTVQREVSLQFGEKELRDRNVVLRAVEVMAGPMDCAADPRPALVPLLAGESATLAAGEGTDPHALDGPGGTRCGALAVSSPADPVSR